MHLRNRALRLMRRAAFVLPLLVLVASACSPDHYPQTALRPLSDFAKIGDDIQTTTFEWALGVFILVEGALLYAIFRFRGKPDDPEPRQVHGNTTIEIIWTVIPALILAAIAVPTVRGIFETNAIPTGDVLKVEVVGHQWWWEFRYPDLNLTTANEIHIPVGQTVSFHMSTADVVHSFWPPQVRRKAGRLPESRDPSLVQGGAGGRVPRPVRGVLRHRARAHGLPGEGADAGGVPGLGGPHADAGSQARGRGTPKRADRGAAASAGGQSGPPSKPRRARPRTPRRRRRGAGRPGLCRGRKAVHGQGLRRAATRCTAVNAPKGMIGPNLANVGARSYIGAGSFKNTDENLARWIQNPQALKQGVLMPNLGVTPEEAKSLVAYLRAHQ